MSIHASRSRHWLFGMIGGGALAMLLASGALPTRNSVAFAQGVPPSGSPQQRIHELEQRVKILELENETLDRRIELDRERYGRAFEDFEKRLRALQDRANTQAEPAAAPDKNAALLAACKDPYVEVGPGVHRVKAGCESTGNECDAPEAVDRRGVRTILPACVSSLPGGGACDVPYVIDSKGVKHFKPECM